MTSLPGGDMAAGNALDTLPASMTSLPGGGTAAENALDTLPGR